MGLGFSGLWAYGPAQDSKCNFRSKTRPKRFAKTLLAPKPLTINFYKPQTHNPKLVEQSEPGVLQPPGAHILGAAEREHELHYLSSLLQNLRYPICTLKDP